MKRHWKYDEVLDYQKKQGQYLIYKNKDDKNIVVPRVDATLPWTVNIANPVTWLILIIIVLIIVICFIINIK